MSLPLQAQRDLENIQEWKDEFMNSYTWVFKNLTNGNWFGGFPTFKEAVQALFQLSKDEQKNLGIIQVEDWMKDE